MTIPEAANPRWMDLELHADRVSADKGGSLGRGWQVAQGLGHRESLLKGPEGGGGPVREKQPPGAVAGQAGPLGSGLHQRTQAPEGPCL